jgi:hypothetical protein
MSARSDKAISYFVTTVVVGGLAIIAYYQLGSTERDTPTATSTTATTKNLPLRTGHWCLDNAQVVMDLTEWYQTNLHYGKRRAFLEASKTYGCNDDEY